MNAHVPVLTLPPKAPDALDLIACAGRVVAAYVSRNHLPAVQVPELLGTVHATVQRLAHPTAEPEVRRPSEAEVRASVRSDAIVSFEDGKPYKALRRHLTLRGLTPEQYRRKYGLPVDYPMVTAEYSAGRSTISRGIAGAARGERAAA